MDFRRKITPQREHNATQASDIRGLCRALESDRGRIINSASVRRLQQKTQVFPLERNAAVRSRLTHSLEVQQVGRFIVQSIFDKLSSEQQAAFGMAEMERPLETLVEMACLMHDIGNPPFGHFGEAAISQWFSDHLDALLPADVALSQEQYQDLCHFEGNAQAIRLVHSLQGLNLTYAQIACILKYTRCGGIPKPEREHPFSYLHKKVGYYLSEQGIVERISDALEMAPGCRHPATYIMEAADDISYCIADIEDAVEKGILDTDKLSQELIKAYADICAEFGLDASAEHMGKVIDKALAARQRESISRDSKYFITLRVGLTHPLVQHAVHRFIDNIDAVYAGSFNHALLEDNSYAHAIAESLKRVALQFAFCDPEVEAAELKGYKIITGLLDCYRSLLTLDRNAFQATLDQQKSARLLDKRLIKKLPGKHIRAYVAALENDCDDSWEFYYRCRLLQDFISGMTDQFAYDEYRSLMVVD